MVASALLRESNNATSEPSKEQRRLKQLGAVLRTMELAPKDPILGISESFKLDQCPLKVGLGVGAYRDDDGAPYVLPSVREAELRMLQQNVNKEYAPIEGPKDYLNAALKFAYGAESSVVRDNRAAACQTVGGTGGNRIAAAFFAKFLGKNHPIYIPTPTWGNHLNIYGAEGLDIRRYRYYDTVTRGLDFDGILADIKNAPSGSIFLLHSCAHNPTGTDPSKEQWKVLSRELRAKDHIVIFDSAYQGFASGDPERDAYAIRLFVEEGHYVILAQSFSKNLGLYGERVGCLSIVCADSEEAARVTSQLKIIIRGMYSNPPIHGANIVRTVFGDPHLQQQWLEECRGMAERIQSMRKTLRHHLEQLGSQHDWSHITSQIGMFCYMGITKEEVRRLREEFHIYMTDDGRISLAGLNSQNVAYVAEAFHIVTDSSTLRSEMESSGTCSAKMREGPAVGEGVYPVVSVT